MNERTICSEEVRAGVQLGNLSPGPASPEMTAAKVYARMRIKKHENALHWDRSSVFTAIHTAMKLRRTRVVLAAAPDATREDICSNPIVRELSDRHFAITVNDKEHWVEVSWDDPESDTESPSSDSSL
jgi:hypothetical protein